MEDEHYDLFSDCEVERYNLFSDCEAENEENMVLYCQNYMNNVKWEREKLLKLLKDNCKNCQELMDFRDIFNKKVREVWDLADVFHYLIARPECTKEQESCLEGAYWHYMSIDDTFKEFAETMFDAKPIVLE